LLGSLVFFGILAVITGFIAYHFFRVIKRDMEKQRKAVEVYTEAEAEYISSDKAVETTRASEFIPLLLIIPIFLYVAFIQISEIIKLGQ